MTGLTTRIALSLMPEAASFRHGIADDEGIPPPEDQGGQGSEESWVRRARAGSFEDALILLSLSMGAFALYLMK